MMGAMKRSLPLVAFALLAPAYACAGDGLDLAIKSKSMAVASAQAVSVAPAAHAGRDPLPELLLRAENEQRDLASTGCRPAATALCYDRREARVVYSGARVYMPHIEGLTPVSVSLRHDGFSLRYSFR
jgi:hypothetical protein